ncbi:MAG: glycosylase [Solobacterium sp.]|nr:glycosylase [Solobacterium sp.]
MPEWLSSAVFYEIYPQSFKDTNDDGIGDLQGIIEKLDYVAELGCNALWINPCFDSPFKDAGYDVRDYKKVAPRYGTNDDLVRLFDTAHEKGIRVLLDLVPGHTSDQHAWFRESCRDEPNEYSGRYVWTSNAFEGIRDHPYISGMADRAGSYMLNFFASQPALNYGWLDRDQKWMSAPDSEEAVATREAMKDVMRFWLDLGCDGFRVDMADSLVKNDDENKTATAQIWRNVRDMLDREYPEAAMVSEWSNPYQAVNGGRFHMDFYLDHWHNGYNTLLRDYECNKTDNSFFRAEGNGDISRFLRDYLPKYEAVKDNGYISMLTCNHDTPRPARTLDRDELKLVFAFLLTMPGVPFLYYGDEIGMRYLDVRTKEGGYHRTGSRTPMQWDRSVNAGFSGCEEKDLYLPVDKSPDAPDVQTMMEQEDSLWHAVQDLIRIRKQYPELQADGPWLPLNRQGHYTFYQRGTMIIGINPSKETVSLSADLSRYVPVYSIGNVYKGERAVRLEKSSLIILRKTEEGGI